MKFPGRGVKKIAYRGKRPDDSATWRELPHPSLKNFCFLSCFWDIVFHSSMELPDAWLRVSLLSTLFQVRRTWAQTKFVDEAEVKVRFRWSWLSEDNHFGCTKEATLL